MYSDKREQFFNKESLELIHVYNFVDGFIDDIERIHKRFKEPILGYVLHCTVLRHRKVDILRTAVDVFVPHVFKDVHSVLVGLMRKSSEDGAELPTEDMLDIYRKIKELWDLYRQIIRKYPFLTSLVD